MIEGDELKRKLDVMSYEMLNKMDVARPAREPMEHKDANWASELPHPCKRFLTYARINGLDRTQMDITGRYRVEEGVKMELDVRHELEKVGFEVVMNQKSVTWEEYKIRGRIDGEVILKTGADRQFIPIEITTVQPWFWDACATIEQVIDHPKFWIRRKPRQLNIYMFCESLPGGLLIVRTFGKRPRILPMLINYELGEKDIATAEEVNLYVEEGEYPDRIPYDNSVCGLCGFQHLCQPIQVSNFDDIEDKHLDDLKRYGELKVYVSEARRLKEKLIGDAKKPGPIRGKNFICEGITVRSTEYESSRVVGLPEDIKFKYTKKFPIVKTTIEVQDTTEEG